MPKTQATQKEYFAKVRKDGVVQVVSIMATTGAWAERKLINQGYRVLTCGNTAAGL